MSKENILTDIPKSGEFVEFHNFIFSVQTVENNRIGKVKIQMKDNV